MDPELPLSDFSLPPPGSYPAAGSFSPELQELLARLLVTAPVNDLGNADIFAKVYKGKMAFVPEWGGWMHYNDRYWERGEYKALDFAGDIIKMRISAFKETTPPNREKAVDYLEYCCNAYRITGILRLAESKLHVPTSKFDANPYLLNVENGVINLKSGELLPHSSEHYMTKWSPMAYDPEAQSQLWDDTVLGIACGNGELLDFFQRLGGYSASGDVSQQYFFYFFGDGANGKSLITDLWAEVLGGFDNTGYAVRIPNETILSRTERTAGAPSPDLLALRGKRMALLSEQSSDRPLNTERIKDLTGGDAITARAPHREPVIFRPTHTLLCCGNHIPYINASDHGFWRRFTVVPFKARFKPSRLGEELRAPEHLSAILTWMVEGARLVNSGFQFPTVVRMATDNCRRESDPLQVWLDERCEPGEEETSVLFNDYVDSCARWHERGMSHHRFTRRLKQMGYCTRKSNGKTFLEGLQLKQGRE